MMDFLGKTKYAKIRVLPSQEPPIKLIFVFLNVRLGLFFSMENVNLLAQQDTQTLSPINAAHLAVMAVSVTPLQTGAWKHAHQVITVMQLAFV